MFFSLPDLEGEIASVRAGLADLDKEMQFFQTNTTERRDKFVPVITSFLTVASYKFSEIEDLHSDMKKKVRKATSYKTEYNILLVIIVISIFTS